MSRRSLSLLHLAGILGVATIAASQRLTTEICGELSVQFPGRISLPEETEYDASVSSYYSEQERDLRPSCIFSPVNAQEVSEFMKLVAPDGQPDSDASSKFAIRGGGHTMFKGAANIDDGVTIDMRSLTSLELSDDQKMASVGGGTIWSDIYPELVPHNLTVLGARVPGVGLGGFATGGGLNFLSRRYGWSCDNIYGYEVVLANGEVVHATASSHEDLWLALKGGSNNFGIITRFDVATFPQGLMWGGVIAFNYTQDVLDAHAEAFSDFMKPENFDDAADMGIILSLDDGVYTVADSLFYVEPVENPPVYQPFTSIPSLEPNTLDIVSVADLVVGFGEFLPKKVDRGVELVYSFKNGDAALYSELFQTWEDGTKAMSDIEGLQVQLLIQPQPGTNGTNSLGLPAGDNEVVISVVTALYANTADQEAVEKGLQAIADRHEEIVSEAGLYVPFKYLNYAGKSQDPIGSYGQDIKERLQAVSKKYDPNGLFQTGVPGGFKLF